MQISAVIVDDEKPARDELAYLLKSFPEKKAILYGETQLTAESMRTAEIILAAQASALDLTADLFLREIDYGPDENKPEADAERLKGMSGHHFLLHRCELPLQAQPDHALAKSSIQCDKFAGQIKARRGRRG